MKKIIFLCISILFFSCDDSSNPVAVSDCGGTCTVETCAEDCTCGCEGAGDCSCATDCQCSTCAGGACSSDGCAADCPCGCDGEGGDDCSCSTSCACSTTCAGGACSSDGCAADCPCGCDGVSGENGCTCATDCQCGDSGDDGEGNSDIDCSDTNTWTNITTHNVSIANYSFTESNLEIEQCDIVIWTNNGSSPHTVTSDSGSELNSSTLSSGSTYEHQFDSLGAFPYHCNFHGSMTGAVTVISFE